MLHSKNNIIVGLTTFHNEMMAIAVPALARLGKNFTLVVHNDNPTTTVKNSDIRKLGYRGKLIVINSAENVGTMRARMAIVNAVAKFRKKPEWIIFNDDDDILTNLDIPKTSPDIFAVVQNMIILRRRVSDLLRVMRDASDFICDGDNVVLDKPHIGFAGTLMKFDVVRDFCAALAGALPELDAIDADTDYRFPVDLVMWAMLGTFVQEKLPNMVPVYMDRANYIATNIDTAVTKYGRATYPARNANEHYSRVIARCDAAFRASLAAAPVGQD